MQAEAGQSLDLILRRKERERKAGGGRFFWGVGNAPSRLIRALARSNVNVPVVFSKMKTKPKAADMNPSNTVLWRQYIDCEGKVRPLPPHVLLTSRGESARGAKRVHYALECYSPAPLDIKRDGEPFYHHAFRNAGGTGRPVGASQVTSLLTPSSGDVNVTTNNYFIDMSSVLVGSYWVKLVDPLVLTPNVLKLIEHADVDEEEWANFSSRIRMGGGPSTTENEIPRML